MDFDWQGMLDFVVSCEKEQSYLKEATPVFMEDQIQHCPEDSYGVAVLSQSSQTTDGSAFPVHSALDTYGECCPTTILPFNSYSPEAEQQCNYTSYEHNFYEQQSSYALPQDYNAPPQDVFNLQQDYYVPPQEMPPNYNEHSQNIEQNVYPVQQQTIPSPESANVEASFPIRIEIMGYVNQDASQVAQRPSTKSTTNRNTKKLKTFTSDWNCSPCGRSFKSKGGLSQHNKQIHSGPTPHGCDICGKRFKDFKTMQQHRQRHLAKDKPFKCDECPKQFFRLSDLQRHVDLHHGMRRYCCSICGKAFGRADHVKDHELSHENGTVKKNRIQKRM